MTDTTPLTVVAALSKVMEQVQAIRKGQKNSAPNAGYMFRGIDAVMNAVGPALRAHGVVIVPEAVTSHYRDVTTSGGKPSREATVTVTYRAYGPAGDSIVMQSAGEAMDSGDKGTPKAMSVAYRTLLLQALTIPTDEPDPDSQTYERAQHPRRDDWPPARQAPNTHEPDGINPAQMKKLHATLNDRGLTDRDDALAEISAIVGRPVDSTKNLTRADASRVIDALTKLAEGTPNA